MEQFLQTVSSGIQSTWVFIISILAEKRGVSELELKYLLGIGITYIVVVFVLHKRYRFLLKRANTQKTKYILACDNIVYMFQNEKIQEQQDYSWIQEVIKNGSYQNSYNLFLEKCVLLQNSQKEQIQQILKTSHKRYSSLLRKKKIYGIFLVTITLGIYKIFLEN